MSRLAEKLLVALAATALVGCHAAPACSVLCEADHRCPLDLVCGADGFCHGPSDPASCSGVAGCLEIEAESGTLVAPMQIGADPGASAGRYVYSDTDSAGAVSFRFDLPQAGEYLLLARVRTHPPESCLTPFVLNCCNSFFLDATDDGHIFAFLDEQDLTAFSWVEVSGVALGTQAGPTGGWLFEAGAASFTFFGREPCSSLDAVALKRCPADGGCSAVARSGCSATSSPP